MYIIGIILIFICVKLKLVNLTYGVLLEKLLFLRVLWSFMEFYAIYVKIVIINDFSRLKAQF